LRILLTITEIGMLGYWMLAALLTAQLVNIPPEYMYSDYKNPFVVDWNWSFLPVDVLFAVTGLSSRFAAKKPANQRTLSTISLTLMFCAGLMAISFWTVRGEFSALWWAMNLWLMALPIIAALKIRRSGRAA
jgi:hypothetical protein